MAEAKPIGFLSVEKAFGGTQYLELLNKVSVYDLAAEIQKDNPTYSITSNAAQSIFNKFSIFKYSKFINGSAYEPAGHFIGFQARPSRAADEFNAAQEAKIKIGRAHV